MVAHQSASPVLVATPPEAAVPHSRWRAHCQFQEVIVMLSLCFKGSRPAVAPQGSSGLTVSRGSATFGRVCSRLAPVACALAALGAVGCGNDDGGDDGDDTVVLADSGELRALTTEIGIPTTVAVSGDT